MKNLPFRAADILLPQLKTASDWEKWSVIACDQFTSEPEYWESVQAFVGGAPSTLNLVLPEVWLHEKDTPQRIRRIHTAMTDAAEGLLVPYSNAMIYVERTLRNGALRRGLVGKLDLEAYSYEARSHAAVRATEGTVLDRIPPRVAVRRNAPIELPHVMVLIDDRKAAVIEPLRAQKSNLKKVYDFDLMQEGGHIAGYLLDDAAITQALGALETLADPAEMAEKYGDPTATMVFAMGDGNHSLASAKAAYEELKKELSPEAAAVHPARYALVELVNLHDASLEFEPIYRTVFGVDVPAFLSDFRAYTASLHGGCPTQSITLLAGTRTETVAAAHPENTLAVGTVQNFLDQYLKGHPGVSLDYIHGTDAAQRLAARDNAVSFLFDGMKKEELFPAVLRDGSLPRKTFSMGEARDKRYYLEARTIR